MHGLTTIAAIPHTGGAGMALRGETNTRPTLPAPARTVELTYVTERGWHSLCLLWLEIEREREAGDLYCGHRP